MMKTTLAALLLSAGSARAGSMVWSGIFNSSVSSATFDKWSWSNQIQPWQWYIHGAGATSEYLSLSPNFKNPADTSDAQGIKITIVCTDSNCPHSHPPDQSFPGWYLFLERSNHGAFRNYSPDLRKPWYRASVRFRNKNFSLSTSLIQYPVTTISP